MMRPLIDMRFLLAIILVCFSARADQITGTWLLDGETSSDGTVITTAIINTMLKGSDIGTWSTGWGTHANDSEQNVPSNLAFATIENDAHHPLFTPFFDGTTAYDGSGNRGLKFKQDRNEMIRLTLDTPDSSISMGFYFNFTGPSTNWAPRDVVIAQDSGGNFQCLQIYDQNSGDFRPYFQAHGAGFGDGDDVYFDRNHWYWVTLYFGSAGQTMRIRFYDAQDNYSLVGESTGTIAGGSTAREYINIGQLKYTSEESRLAGQALYFDNIIFSSAGTFPLGPGTGGNNPYWVSPTGASSWAGAQSPSALSGTACASITTMNANVTAGDTVNFRTGNYTTQINPGASGSGTVSARVTLQAYNGESVTMSNINNYAIDLTGMDYYFINDINMQSNFGAILMAGSDFNTVTNVLWTDFKFEAGNWWNAIRISLSSHHNVFVDMEASECGSEEGGDDVGRVMALGTENTTDLSTNNLFLRCTFARGGHDTVTVFSRFNRFQDCHFYNDVWYPTSGALYGNRNVAIDGPGGLTSQGWNIFDNCTFFRAAPPADAVGVASFTIRSHRNIIRRCRFVDGADAGININRAGYHDSQWSPQTLVAYNYVYHNTVVNNGINTGNTDDDRTAGMTFNDDSDGSPPVATNSILNNIFWDNVDDRAFGFEGVTSNDNTFAGNLAESADPLFVDWNVADLDPDNPTAHDFTLTSSSPAINAGSFLTTITSATGSGTSFVVGDAGFFTDGEGIYAGDSVQVQGQTTPVTVTDVNYVTQTITVGSSLSWTNGNGLALTYSGSAPDQGAFEFTGPSVGNIQFASATYNVDEDGGTVTNIVTRTGGSSGAVGVTYITADGTATNGVDYTAITNTLSWADGNTDNKQVIVTITNDGDIEDPETFTVTLSSPTGGASLGSPSTTTVTILDDETPVPPLMPALSWDIEDMQIVLPFVEAGDLVAQSSETTDPATGGSATARFTILVAGNYTVNMLVDAANASSDSIFINIDAEPTSPTMIWDIAPLTSGVEQRTVGWRGSGGVSTPEFPTKTWNLSAAVHTMYIRGREANTELDFLTVVPVVGSVTNLQVTGNAFKVSGNAFKVQ